MEILFIVLAIWLIPIILTGLMLYLAMEKSQTVENFIYQHDLNESFFGMICVPVINCIVCIITFGYFGIELIKHWKK